MSGADLQAGRPRAPTGSAVIDATGRYRYALRRRWHEPEPLALGGRYVLWIMLNPSTADATVDDPTIRRCIGFSQAWGFDGLSVVNLFALRATSPRALWLHPDASVVGPENDAVIAREVAAATFVVAAWGNHGTLHNRADDVRERIGPGVLHHLGLTKAGQPRHPLYVRADAKPQMWGQP